VRIDGIGVLDPERGFLCEGCNVLAGAHHCEGATLKLHCDCPQTDPCGGERFRRYCDAGRAKREGKTVEGFEHTLTA
jgi:hypothetical protein